LIRQGCWGFPSGTTKISTAANAALLQRMKPALSLENAVTEGMITFGKSKPYNPLIAGAFFRSGQIEAWGRGVEKITIACKEWGKPAPFYRVRPNEVMIGFVTEEHFGL
jgi:predicted HTH transcriptional regulator